MFRYIYTINAQLQLSITTESLFVRVHCESHPHLCPQCLIYWSHYVDCRRHLYWKAAVSNWQWISLSGRAVFIWTNKIVLKIIVMFHRLPQNETYVSWRGSFFVSLIENVCNTWHFTRALANVFMRRPALIEGYWIVHLLLWKLFKCHLTLKLGFPYWPTLKLVICIQAIEHGC